VQGPAWHQRQLVRCGFGETDGRLSPQQLYGRSGGPESRGGLLVLAGRWHLDRLIAAAPDDARHWAARGDVHAWLGQWQQAVNDYTEAVRRGREDVRLGRADAYAELGRWQEAAADLARVVEQQPDNTWRRRQQGLLLLRNDERQGFVRACTAALESREKAERPGFFDQDVIGLCVLAREGEIDHARVLRLAERLADDGERLRSRVLSGSTLKAAALYRTGRYPEALAVMEKASAQTRETTAAAQVADLAFLAMTHHRLGHGQEARQCLDRLWGLFADADKLRTEHAGADADTRARLNVPAWEDWLEMRELALEAERVAGGMPRRPVGDR
jgi:tetratricopeptide (TPR) repeat protein